MPKSLVEINELANLYDIPFEDVLFIDFNRRGVVTDREDERIRFYFRLSDNPYLGESKKRDVRDFFFAVPTHSGISNYYLGDGTIFLGNEEIGKVYGIESDTCDSTYPRRNGTVFNLNAKSKSTCHGCAFCHTFKQIGRDIINLSPEVLITNLIEQWLKKYGKTDLSYLYRLDIVTGCFEGEVDALKHLYLARDIFSRYNYHGEIFYFGSEITSEQGFNALKEIEPIGLCLSLECFTNREKLLRQHKGRISLESAKEVLDMSREIGFGTQFSYVLGMEPLDLLVERMSEFVPHINRLPVINIFQPHTPAQRKLLVPEANELEYFLHARKELEKIFVPTVLRPRTWGNYRCLWYLKFGTEFLDGPRLP